MHEQIIFITATFVFKYARHKPKNIQSSQTRQIAKPLKLI